jgi:PAS domain S-box-containing protein
MKSAHKAGRSQIKPVGATHMEDMSTAATVERGRSRITTQPRVAEPRFRATFERAPAGMAHVSLDCRWLAVNQRFCAIVGYQPHELLGHSTGDITYEEDREPIQAHIQRMLDTKTDSFDLDKRYIRKDGSLVWIHLLVSLIRTASGAPSYYVTVVEDISERKRAEEERARLLERERAAHAEAAAARAQLQAIQSITDAALVHYTLDEALGEVLERIRGAMGVNNVAILLRGEDGQYLTVRAARGVEEEYRSEIRVRFGHGVAGRIAASRQPMIVDDISQVEVATPVLKQRLRSLVGVPLLVDRRVIGVVIISTTEPRRFTESDAHLLQLIADRVALAIDRATLYELAQAARAEAEARASQLVATFEAIPDGVVVYDSEGYILQSNAAMRELLGIQSQPDYFARRLHDRLARLNLRDEQGSPLPEDRTPMVRVLEGEVLTGANATDILLHTLDGRDVQIHLSGTPIRDSEGHITGAVLVSRDVTERRRLERRTHEALSALLAMAETLVLVTDSVSETGQDVEGESTPPGAYGVAQRLAELTRSVFDCQGVGIARVVPQTDAMQLVALVGLSAERGRQWVELLENTSFSDLLTPPLAEQLRNGKVLVLDASGPIGQTGQTLEGTHQMLVAPMRVGEQMIGILAVEHSDAGHTYTEQDEGLARAVAKLAALIIERERLLREHAEAQANELALRETNRRMSDWLSIAVHELRAPLTVMKATVHMHAGKVREDNQREAEFSRRIGRQVARLERLVSDLVDESRIQSGKLELKPERRDLVEIAGEAVEEQRNAHPTRHIELKVDVKGLLVEADADRVGQVITNYLTNALKYSWEAQPVEIRLEVVGDRARVSVRDQGPGLPPEEQERIWERFHRAKDIAVQTGSGVGLGLGLHISKSIIEQHGGTVGLDSTVGQGSTFWFTLPLARATTSEI